MVPSSHMILALNDLRDYDVTSFLYKTILDVGAYIGDSSLFFISRKARKVYAYEPVFYETYFKNIELNHALDKVVVIPKGIYYKYGQVCVEIDNGKQD